MMDHENELHWDGKNITPRPLSRLTYKIMGMNVIMLAVLAMSFSYINQTRENLISNEVNNFGNETRLYKAVIEKQASLARDGLQTISNSLIGLNINSNQQILLFDRNGDKIAVSGEIPERKTYTEIHDKNLSIWKRGFAIINDIVSVNFNLPPFPDKENLLQGDTPKLEQTINGLNIAAWSAPDGGLILSADTDLRDGIGEKIGMLKLIRRDLEIENAFSETRLAVFRFVLISLVLTTSFSLYLASVIGHPLRNLAMAAEAFRLNKGRDVEIPDLSARNDEIGELSEAMREMAEALRQRLQSIESFAADVAHELKNPLTSMRSAVETLPKVRKEEDRERLTNIIHHDLQRMDRLISDISQASRLDAELSRDILLPLDIRQTLNQLIDGKRSPMDRGKNEGTGFIIRVGFQNAVMVVGQAGRLLQVFENLISNALSFSPAEKPITVTIDQNEDRTKIMVDDEGPGIPENRLHKIFDRFYSERPSAENFGMHSGLGLSIAKQIVESHGGTLVAENRKGIDGRILGARFIVRLRNFDL